MIGFSIAAKLVGESRTEVVDVSASLGPTDILVSASATCSVYTGVDPNPSSVLGAPTINSIYNLVNLPLTAGVVGCIYQIVLTVTFVSALQKTFTTFLVVVPDAV
jgi:hypothetical protein